MNISLSNHQRVELEKLFHLYGNNGAKSNLNQHRLIQTILEKGWYSITPWSEIRSKGVAKKIAPEKDFNDYGLSSECVIAVCETLDI